MKIALDATPLSVPTGGVARYTAELALALAARFPQDDFHLLSDQPFSPPAHSLPNLHIGRAPRGALERHWWLWGLQRELGRLRIDVFHGTDFAVPYLPIRAGVLTLHDLSPWRDAAWHTAASRVRRRTPMLLRLGLAAMVLTPSEAIRREAILRFRLPPDRIVGIPHAASALFRPVAPQRSATPYFLYVGTLEPRKNLALLVNAWREVRKRHCVDLVIAGRRREDFPEIPPERGLRLKGVVSDEELPQLYSSCLACVYPSLYEGFGLPVLEAMQCGAAVITSQDPAIVETAGGAAITLDAAQPQAWVEALTAALEKPSWVSNLRERSLHRAGEFSWASTAAKTREVYAEAARRFHGR